MQDRLTPNCFIAPTNSQQVSQIVGLLAKNSCQFAIRSGGHGLLVGSSNIAIGVTIDLSGLNSVTLSDDKSVARVGAGSKWIHVYETLDPMGYAIPGGRAGDVGVGGLTSGGTFAIFYWHFPSSQVLMMILRRQLFLRGPLRLCLRYREEF